MTTVLAFVLTIFLLVVFHEFGHYWVARQCGVKVLRFSIGFGKTLFAKRFAKSETEWVISAIPLGGYVKMLDEREGEVLSADLPYAFNRKPVLQRMAIVLAGPIANFLLAVVLYWGLFVHGVPGVKPILGEVTQGSPAAVAQMQDGETITNINGDAIPDWEELRWRLLDLGLQQKTVSVEGLSSNGSKLVHQLDLSSLKPSDLDGDFTRKLGLHQFLPPVLPVIGQVIRGSVAEASGLQAGDIINGVGGTVIQRWDELVDAVRNHPGQQLRLNVKRGKQDLIIVLIPESIDESGKQVGKIGAAPKVDQAEWQALLTTVSYGPISALQQSLRKTSETTTISLKMLAKMLTGQVSMKNLSGPISIADYAGQSAHMGVVTYLGFLALISISLGVLNLLPIPLLDGGHLLYYAVEWIKGSPVSEQVWEVGQKIGIALLGTLMIFALYNDVNRLIPG